MSAETERIAEGDIDFALLCFVKGHVQARIKFRVVCEMINSRRYDRLIDGQQAGDGFNGSRRTEEVTSHGFRGADIHFVSVIAEYLLYRFYFADIAQGRRRSVCVHVVNVSGI